MAIQWMDNFAAYGVGGSAYMLNGPYANVAGVGTALVADPDPTAPGSVVFRNGFGVIEYLRKVLTTGRTTVGVAMRRWLTSLPSNNNEIDVPICFNDGSNNILVKLQINSTGSITATNGAGTALGTTTGPVIVANAWQHIEAKVFFHATAGTVEVRVEGVTVLALVAQDTLGGQAGPCAQIANRNNSGAGNEHYLKDYIIWDNSGMSNTDFLGSCAVISLTPSSDVSLNWTPSSGATGWNLINESPPNDDTGYIQAPTPPPAAAVFGLTDLPAHVTSVKALMTLVRSRKTDGGDGNLQVSMVSGGSTTNGTDRPITTAYTYWSDLFPLDPATAAAWLPSAVNAANLQLNRTL